MAGSVRVELEDGESCCVGIEGSVEYRKHLWKRRSQVVGLVGEVHYQSRTVNLDGTPRLQFGVLKKIREDKS
jgi:hypothetical protein